MNKLPLSTSKKIWANTLNKAMYRAMIIRSNYKTKQICTLLLKFVEGHNQLVLAIKFENSEQERFDWFDISVQC